MTSAAVEAKLAKLKREAWREWRRRAAPVRSAVTRDAPPLARAVALTIFKLTAIVALPFLVLGRASVYFYLHLISPWPALPIGAPLPLPVVAAFRPWLLPPFTG